MKRLAALTLTLATSACGGGSSGTDGGGAGSGGSSDAGGSTGGSGGSAGAGASSTGGMPGTGGTAGGVSSGGSAGSSGGTAGVGGGAAGVGGGAAGAGGGAAGAGGNCPLPNTVCGSACVDTAQDPRHCGGCDQTCPSGEVCTVGSCDVSCVPSQVLCNDRCIDPLTDRAFCGASGDCMGSNAGTPCPDGEVCSAGSCGVSCIASQIVCNDQCIDPLTDRAFCGASGDCTGGDAGTPCVDGEVCSTGTCAPSCGAGLTECAGACTNTDTDPAHCGGCNAPCTVGEICTAGRCREVVREWGTPEAISTTGAQSARIDVNAAGHAAVVWLRSGAVYANHFDGATEVWGTEERIEMLSAASQQPQVDQDAAGNAFAVWAKFNSSNGNRRAWTGRYDKAAGVWGDPDALSTGQRNVHPSPQVQVAINGGGEGVTAWPELATPAYQPQASRLDAQTLMWSAPVSIESQSPTASRVKVGIDASGNAIATFRVEASTQQIWATRYDAQAGSWGTEQLVGSNGGFNPEIAVAANGDAIVIWPLTSVKGLWANRYDVSNGTWGTAERIDTGSGSANIRDPQVGADAAGNAIAVWPENGDLWARRYDVQAGAWGAAERIEPDGAAIATVPQIGVDASGRAVVVWRRQNGANFSVASNSYSAKANRWTGAARVDVDGGGTPDVDVDASGQGIAVWVQGGFVWANRYR